MCPACLSVAAAYVAGAGSLGGVALLLKKLGHRVPSARSPIDAKQGSRLGNDDSGRRQVSSSEFE
jgi:hypothetical protein